MESALHDLWQRLNPALQPPSQRGTSLAFDKKRGQSVLVAAGETWLWNGASWSQAQSQAAPPARSTTHLVYDGINECVLLYGGVGIDGTPLNDVWLWDGQVWTEQHPRAYPTPVGGAALACDLKNRQAVLFGGIMGFDGASGSNRVGTFSNETWVWNGTTWREQPASGGPSARVGGQLVYDEVRQHLLLFGGHNATGYLNDMWRWNGGGWNQLSPTTLPPMQGRYCTTFHAQLQRVILLAEVMDDLNQQQSSYQMWLWDGASWSQSPQKKVLPGSIEGFAYDGLRQALVAQVVIGGKSPLVSKSAGGRLPELAMPELTSETWVW